MVKSFSSNPWQMMPFLNPLDTLIPKIPFSFFLNFGSTWWRHNSWGAEPPLSTAEEQQPLERAQGWTGFQLGAGWFGRRPRYLIGSGGGRYSPLARPPKKGSIDAPPPNRTETDPRAPEVIRDMPWAVLPCRPVQHCPSPSRSQASPSSARERWWW